MKYSITVIQETPCTMPCEGAEYIDTESIEGETSSFEMLTAAIGTITSIFKNIKIIIKEEK